MFRGFITNVEKYNNGELVGRWINFPLEKDAEDILESIGLEDEGGYIFTGWESDYSEIIKGLYGYDDIYELEDLAEELERVYDVKHLLAYIEVTGYDLQYSIEHYEDLSVYYGYIPPCDIAEELISIDSRVWEIIRAYFDCENYIEDCGVTDTDYGYIMIY